MKPTRLLALSLLALSSAAVSCGTKKPGTSTDQSTTEGDRTTPAPAGESRVGLIDSDALPAGTTITGVVRLEGEVPTMPALDISPRDECVDRCRELGVAPRAEYLVLGPDNTVKDAVVHLKKGVKGRYKPHKEAAVIDQIACVYTPHVFTIMVQQDLLIKNSDPFTHNVKISAIDFNISLTAKDTERLKAKLLKRRGVFRIECDVHPWMTSYAVATPHPFSDVTQEDGMFTIADVPPGEYTIGVWHERLPGLEQPPDQEIEIKPGEKTKEVSFTFRFPARG